MFHTSWWGALALSVALIHVVIVLVTVYFHRAMAHRAVSFHPALNRVFRFLSWFLLAMKPQEFAAVHRKHHATCDTNEDPHAPGRFGLFTVLFAGLFLYRREAAKAATIEQYGKGLPVDPWEGFYARFPNLGILLFAGLLSGLFGLKGAFVWISVMVAIPFWAAGVINGLGHAIGYRNFPTDDASTNLVPWGIWLGGEELHNNHHADPSSAKFSSAWYEVDIGWGYIRLFQALGLATLREKPGRAAWAAEPRAMDVSTVGNILRARHAWLAHLHASFSHDARAVLREHGFRRWRDLSTSWDRGLDRLSTRHRQRLEAAQAHPLLARLRALELELRTLWATRRQGAHETLLAWEAWLAQARAEALPRLSQFCDRLSGARWHPTVA